VSLAGWIIIALLVFSEVNNFLSPKPKEHMVVDTTLGQQLKININISFHALTCAEVLPSHLSGAFAEPLRCTLTQWTSPETISSTSSTKW
jgi:hypothetical protein